MASRRKLLCELVGLALLCTSYVCAICLSVSVCQTEKYPVLDLN